MLLVALYAAAVPQALADAPARFAMSVQPLYAMCLELVAKPTDCARVLAPGVSPHGYEPRPSDVKRATDAAALFFVSPLLDGWATRLNVKKRYKVIDMLPQAMRLAAGAHDHGHGHGHGGAKGGVDPHFWLDPLAIKAVLPGLAAAFCEVAPSECKVFQGNAERHARELDQLHAQVTEALAPVKDRAFVVYHPFLGYLVRRYGLKQVGEIEPAPGREPSPRHLKATIDMIRKTGARAILVSPEIPDRAARAAAEATGVAIHEVDDLGGTAGRERLPALIRHDVAVLVKALQ